MGETLSGRASKAAHRRRDHWAGTLHGDECVHEPARAMYEECGHAVRVSEVAHS